MYITSNRGVWRHGSGTEKRSEEYGGFLKQAFSNSWYIKTTWEVVSTGEVLWSARLNTRKNDCESTRRSFQSVRSYEEVRGASSARVIFVHRVQSQRPWTATVRHLICGTSGIGNWTADIVTVIDIATPRWRLKSSEYRNLPSCDRAQLLALARLAKLSFVTFSLAEPANWLYCRLTD